MTVVTVVTDEADHGLVNFLIPTAKFYRLNLTVLAIDAKAYESHRKKDELLMQFLQGYGNDEIILFTDGYDTMFLSDEAEILQKYAASGKTLLFSAEMNCWPDRDVAKHYPKETSPFKYLCSGGFIGPAGYIKTKIEEGLMTASIMKYPLSNQIYWTEQYIRNTTDIGLDTQCEVFATLSSELDMIYYKQEDTQNLWVEYTARKKEWFAENFKFINGRMTVVSTNSRPCHLHANGLSKVLASEIVHQLPYLKLPAK